MDEQKKEEPDTYERLEETLKKICVTAEDACISLPELEGPGRFEIAVEIGADLAKIAVSARRAFDLLREYLGLPEFPKIGAPPSLAGAGYADAVKKFDELVGGKSPWHSGEEEKTNDE